MAVNVPVRLLDDDHAHVKPLTLPSGSARLAVSGSSRSGANGSRVTTPASSRLVTSIITSVAAAPFSVSMAVTVTA